MEWDIGRRVAVVIWSRRVTRRGVMEGGKEGGKEGIGIGGAEGSSSIAGAIFSSSFFQYYLGFFLWGNYSFLPSFLRRFFFCFLFFVLLFFCCLFRAIPGRGGSSTVWIQVRGYAFYHQIVVRQVLSSFFLPLLIFVLDYIFG